MIELPRSSGVQLHLTSLPGGRLGPEAYRFVDWLAAAGQTWWQVLPLGPPDRYRSPYKARSAFAAWPGFLGDPRAPVSAAEVLEFREREAFWAVDWERFSARGALADQVRFEREWSALRCLCARNGGFGCSATWRSTWRRTAPTIAPIPSCSAPAWSRGRHRTRSRTTGSYGATRCTTGRRCAGAATAGGSSGCGGRCRCSIWPGSTTSAGSWPTGRCRQGARTARVREAGSAGPGGRCSTRFRGRLGDVALVAEDLGVITPAVTSLRESLGFPGMVVLQFGFDPPVVGSPHAFENHVEDRVVYTGTHDHDTASGWYSGLSAELRSFVDSEFARYGVVDRDPWWSLIRLALEVAGAGRDAPGPGRARAGVGGAHERPGAGGRQLAVADGGRRAHAGAGAAAARGDRGRGAAGWRGRNPGGWQITRGGRELSRRASAGCGLKLPAPAPIAVVDEY